MKVSGPHQAAPIEIVRGRRDSPVPARQHDGTERVDVSSEAQALRDARAPEAADAARVERLREAIAKGAFVIDPDRIAALMLGEER
jgi:flagellar biosynthesis anti-sigma factor FlgM